MHTTLISPAAAADHLADPDYLFVDVRHDLAQPDTWGEAQFRAGHLPGAVFAHLDRDLSAAKTGRNGRHPLPPPEVVAARFGALGIGPATQVVAYDQGNGMYAARLWWMLRWLGHRAVAVLDGGYDAWTRAGWPTTTAIAAPRAAAFGPAVAAPIADAAELMASLASRSLLVVDARAPERFRGDTEPLDPVAGHIPGAVNRPFGQNLGADGRFKPAATLRAEFEALFAGRPPSAVVAQCGSGVTACHHLLALAHAGIDGARLYPGSWSEWVADAARPVATGP